ncbi:MULTISPECIES: hypothetical protein [unclassified Bradyrhizobium]|uniref:hypothetical protein n=1 Tax=unclassified Bradyrhizobium TaxID=2631580 RepID=UPI001FFB709B|nr:MULTISPECIES: hypothetical protein [unclassified Bradyrhizobium]MCK1540348.1 hypothetical protein [Bradyrhizobium sp. 176]MCK1556190.1 hypothetical protein [Bradyrhizobium sp. 171]
MGGRNVGRGRSPGLSGIGLTGLLTTFSAIRDGGIGGGAIMVGVGRAGAAIGAVRIRRPSSSYSISSSGMVCSTGAVAGVAAGTGAGRAEMGGNAYRLDAAFDVTGGKAGFAETGGSG